MRTRAPDRRPSDDLLDQQLREAQRALAVAIDALDAGTRAPCLEQRAISRELLEGLRDSLVSTTERLNRLCSEVFRLPSTPAGDRSTPERST